MGTGSELNKEVRSQEVTVRARPAEAVRTLRTLSNEEAFHFYEDIGKPTGEHARSLRDFLERIESVTLESLIFHLKRNDFGNWIENTLEDQKLGKELAKIQVTHGNTLRAEVCSIVQDRLNELEVTSDPVTIHAVEPATITTIQARELRNVISKILDRLESRMERFFGKSPKEKQMESLENKSPKEKKD